MRGAAAAAAAGAAAGPAAAGAIDSFISPTRTLAIPPAAAYDHAKRHYYVSLRSDSDDVDVSVIAKSLGGGGHKRASGFTCASLADILRYEDGAPVGGGGGGGGAAAAAEPAADAGAGAGASGAGTKRRKDA